MQEEFKKLDEEGVKLKLQSVLDYLSKEGGVSTLYSTPEEVKELQLHLYVINQVISYCTCVEVSSYSKLLDSIIATVLEILEKNLHREMNVEATKLLVKFIFNLKLYFSSDRTISEESREYFVKIEKEKPAICQRFLRSFSNHPIAIENFLFALSHLHGDSLPIFIEVLNFYKANKDSINLRVKCYIFNILNAIIDRSYRIEKTQESWKQELPDYCMKELEENYEKAMELQIPATGMNDFIFTEFSIYYQIPINESTEDDCLRLLLKYCFRFIHALTFFQEEEYLVMLMKYAKNATDPFIRNEALTNLTCYKIERWDREKDTKIQRILQICLDNGLLDILSWYLDTFKLIGNGQNPSCFDITDFHIRQNEEGHKPEVVDSLKFLTIQLITNSKIHFGGSVLNLIQKLPNIDLFIRKLILEGTGLVRGSYRGGHRFGSATETTYRDILRYLVSECQEDDAVLNEFMTPKYNLFYFLIQSLGSFSGFADPSHYHCGTGIMNARARNSEIRSLHKYGICKLMRKFGFEKAIKCVPSFPLLLEAKESRDEGKKTTPIFNFLLDLLQNETREEKCKITSFFIACGIRVPNKLQDDVDEVIKRKVKEITVLLHLASTSTITRIKNKNGRAVLSPDFLRILKEMLNEDNVNFETEETEDEGESASFEVTFGFNVGFM